MAITIRNKALEAEIKAIGARLNKGPTDVLKHLVEEHRRLAEEAERQRVEALIARRRTALDRLMAQAAKATDEDRRIMQQNLDDMYDDDGLPR